MITIYEGFVAVYYIMVCLMLIHIQNILRIIFNWRIIDLKHEIKEIMLPILCITVITFLLCLLIDVSPTDEFGNSYVLIFYKLVFRIITFDFFSIGENNTLVFL